MIVCVCVDAYIHTTSHVSIYILYCTCIIKLLRKQNRKSCTCKSSCVSCDIYMCVYKHDRERACRESSIAI